MEKYANNLWPGNALNNANSHRRQAVYTRLAGALELLIILTKDQRIPRKPKHNKNWCWSSKRP